LLGDRPLTIDHISYDRIPVVNPLANLIRGITLMYERYEGGDSHDWHQQEATNDEHEDVSDEPPYAEDHEPRHLVPQRLQSVEGHLLGPTLVEQPDDEGRDWASETGYQVERYLGAQGSTTSARTRYRVLVSREWEGFAHDAVVIVVEVVGVVRVGPKPVLRFGLRVEVVAV